MRENSERFLQMPEIFDAMAPYMVPQYDLLQESIFDLVSFERDRKIRFLDLGAGSGIQIERILNRFPNSTAYYLDSSPPFMEAARKRLRRFDRRVHFIRKSFEEDWIDDLSGAVDLIVSMSAIHHLEPEGKKALCKKTFAALSEGGWFFNIDEMRSPDDSSYKNSMLFWYDYAQRAADRVPISLKDHYEGWMSHFTGWKSRNIDHFGEPKTKGDDCHETFQAQLEYLAAAGFHDADLFVKYHLWCVIGGRIS